jgi:hypothetical protein
MKKHLIWYLYGLIIISLIFSIVFNKIQADYSTDKLNEAIDNSKDYELRLKLYAQEDSIILLMNELKNLKIENE